MRRSSFFSLAGLFVFVPLLSVADDLKFEERASFSATPQELLSEARNAGAAPGDNALFLLDDDRWIFDKNGDIERSKHIVFEVLTARGIQTWSNFVWLWEPWHQKRPAVRIRVITPDGLAHELDQSTLVDAPANSEAANLYSDARVVKCPLPAMVPGSVVEEEIRESTTHLLTGTMRILGMDRVDPVKLARIYLESPIALPMRYSTFHLPGEKETKSAEGGKNRLTLQAGPLPARAAVQIASIANDPASLPRVMFSVGGSWKDLAAEYNRIVEQRIASADVASFVQTATANAKDQAETIERLVRELHKQVRYTGVEFGNAAIIPAEPGDTLKRKYGDCKDKATLLVAMLRAAKIPAYLALLSAGAAGALDADEQFPGFGFFNHAIVYVPGSPDLWIDATAEYLHSGYLPAMDQGRRALVIRPETAGLKLIPESASTANRYIQTREFFLPENGKATVVVTREGVGNQEAYLRANFGSDTEALRKNLETYSKSQYLSEAPVRIEHPRGDDFTRPFHVRLEVNDSKRGIVSPSDAAVVLVLSDLFEPLPAYLKTEDAAGAEKSVAFKLPESFVTECHYRIHMPLGFQVTKVPEPQTAEWGAAHFTSRYHAGQDLVTADFVFDVGKRAYTAAEGAALKKSVVEFLKKPLMITLQPVGMAYLSAGKIREAIQQFRSMSERDPKDALYRVQLSNALLAAGCGQRARAEALRATEVDPKSAVAFQNLGFVLSNDLIGRRFGRGFDAAGAEAADRKAVELDPKNVQAKRNLAILLEYGKDGYRYSLGARFDEAVKLYRETETDTPLGPFETNLMLDLAYAGRFKELREEAEKLAVLPQNTSFKLLATSKLESTSVALAEAEREMSAEGDRSRALQGAGDLLLKLRDYQAGVELLTASAKGSDNATQTMNRANLFRNVKRLDGETRQDTPEHLIQTFLTTAATGHIDAKFFERIMAREALASESPESLAGSSSTWVSAASAFAATSGFPPQAWLDLSLALAEMKIDANGEDGCRVRLTTFNRSSPTTFFFVKEGADWRVLGLAKSYDGIARRILADVAGGNLTSARRWLDFVREDVKIEGGDDPLAGWVFPRIWTKGAPGDAAAIRYAAAELLGHYEKNDEAIAALRQRMEQTKEEPAKTYAQLAYVSACGVGHKWTEAFPVAKALAAAHPESASVASWLMNIYVQLKQYDDLKRLAAERLARDPDEAQTSRMLAYGEVAQGKYAEGEALFRKIAESSKGNASDWNQVGWLSLFAGDLNADTTNRLQREAGSAPEANLLHTLAAMYAEAGKTTEARETILLAMRNWGIEEPNSNSWLVFGRLAEQFGVTDEAVADYNKVKNESGSSSYILAQKRLALLKK